MSARVFLGDLLVGELTPDPSTQTTTLTFDPTYVSNGARPVLGRCFEDCDIAPPRSFSGKPLPSYFRNLLPEGALRKMVEARLGTSSLPEYAMLLRLGEHLPGAVRVLSDELDSGALEDEERRARAVGDPYRFALAGNLPKLSLSEHDDQMTVPLEGQEGFWVAKFGSPAWKNLVENEATMLTWATRCGLEVPEHRLIRAHQIARLPEDFEPDQDVLIVRRFDRATKGARIHQEDFAQVFGLEPEAKSVTDDAPEWLNYATIGAVVFALCGFEDYLEYLRRLVFMALSGNHDAHAKNWALIYPNGLHARIAPVYDFVATVAYTGLGPYPALRWSTPLEPTLDPGKPLVEATLEDLLVVASYTEADTAKVMDEITRFAKLVRDTWPEVAKDAPAFIESRVTGHLARAALK